MSQLAVGVTTFFYDRPGGTPYSRPLSGGRKLQANRSWLPEHVPCPDHVPTCPGQDSRERVPCPSPYRGDTMDTLR